MITPSILFAIFFIAQGDSEVKFVKPDINLDGSKLENVFSVDNMELIQNLNQDSIDSDTKILPNPIETENKSSTVENKTVAVDCILRTVNEDEIVTVTLANSSTLLKALTPNVTNSTYGECLVVLFYSSQCMFSARMAPHYNALPRVFPAIPFYALDVTQHYNIHIRYGVVAVPSILLFHNGKSVARFNDTIINIFELTYFIGNYTNVDYKSLNRPLLLTLADWNGPVPATLNKKVDFVLILAWVFTIFCICVWFLKSSLCHRIVESIKNTWREAEAQHEHVE